MLQKTGGEWGWGGSNKSMPLLPFSGYNKASTCIVYTHMLVINKTTYTFCVHACIGVRCLYTWKLEFDVSSSSISVYLIRLVTYLESWFLTELGVRQRLDCLTSEASGSIFIFSPQSWGCTHMLLCSAFMGVLGIWIQGPMPVKQALSCLLSPTFPFFAIIWVVHRGTCHRTASREVNVGTKEHILSIGTFGEPI